ncbi:TlpA disulfide reductase family protein [Cytophagales bacterium LB-30]|uniref:TlpA disulfide reductase family protein n=1 Tax=Shiella aurantiaca TaxID=3058365 RepID=A0ABT8F953_9BACT|nr:TlpA disulfide reductase family protein [Shiella aurantiaca]MDN4166784.1 TlpA disulfide reductase family protein [Shiella aurantiaca]
MPLVVQAQEAVTIVKFEDLHKELSAQSDSATVINFWATWCKPCVKELPYFEEYHRAHPEVRMLLVSLDFSEEVEKVNTFLAKKKITIPVVLLDETDYNSFIDKIEPTWSGAIPATIFLRGKKRIFVEHELVEGEIDLLIQQLNRIPE